MRLFVAVDPPASAVDHLRDRLPEVDGLRWTAPEQWHLTLTFCGQVDGRRAADLTERLARAVTRHTRMRLRLRGAGAFSRPGRAHALWVGVGGDTERLAKLAASTTAAARRAGIAVDERRFRAHLTIARASPARDLRQVVGELSSYDGPCWNVTELHLVRSRLGAKTTHERVASWQLG